MNDKQSGKLVGKGIMELEVHNSNSLTGGTLTDDVYYTITIDVKDGRYKCTLSDFTHDYSGVVNGKYAKYSFGSLNYEEPKEVSGHFKDNSRWYQIKKKSMYRSQKLLISLSEAMHKKSDNW